MNSDEIFIKLMFFGIVAGIGVAPWARHDLRRLRAAR